MNEGKRLARLAQEGAKVAECGKMCADCAFRIQEDINGYSEAVNAAAGMLETGYGVYHCHTAEYKDAGKPCVGFQYAVKAIEHKAKELLTLIKNGKQI